MASMLYTIFPNIHDFQILQISGNFNSRIQKYVFNLLLKIIIFKYGYYPYSFFQKIYHLQRQLSKFQV